MKSDILLLIIDMQNDFCAPSGALYVKGAEEDTRRTGRFIIKNLENIDHIVLTQDNHHVVDISHPAFWEDRNGKHPEPFTEIKSNSVLEGLWIPRYQKDKAIEYIRKLENQGEFPHVIWPEHCIIGSYGAAIAEEVLEPVKNWARTGKYYDVVRKGTHPLTEHFGALKAHVPVPGYPETHVNTELVNKLNSFKKIYVAGEARSHCVATTIKQILQITGQARKLHIIEDCMSDVTGFESNSVPIFERARSEGAKFVLSRDILE
jgi:nicotinamidase/pyrazinamidase